MNNNKNTLGVFNSVLVVLLIGSISSGFWELFLRDFVVSGGALFVKTMSAIYTGYIDTLFEKVGRQSDAFLYIPSLFLVSLMIASPLLFYIYIRKSFRKVDIELASDNSQKKLGLLTNLAVNHRKVFLALMMTPLLYTSVIYTNILVVSITNGVAVHSMDRWLHIIRPYITENQYHTLVSEFRQVNSAKDYQLLVDKVEGYAEEFNVFLPELEVYGIVTKSNPTD